MSDQGEDDQPEDWKTFDKAAGCARDGAMGCLPVIAVLLVPAFLLVSG